MDNLNEQDRLTLDMITDLTDRSLEGDTVDSDLEAALAEVGL